MNAWLFDVDGVITNPIDKKITQKDIIPEILRRLRSNEPVALVSGRAVNWLKTQVVNKIEECTDDKRILDFLFISGEFGGVNITFQNGDEIEESDQKVSLPKDLQLELGNIVNMEFSDISFVDPEKITHFTAEMRQGITMDLFKKRQLKLSEKFIKIVNSFPEKDEIEVQNDRIATNVKNKKLNKHLSVQKVLEWLDKKNINPELFLVFGDQDSDLEMGIEFKSLNLNFKFIYVGENLPLELPFEIIQQGKLDEGTAIYLKAN